MSADIVFLEWLHIRVSENLLAATTTKTIAKTKYRKTLLLLVSSQKSLLEEQSVWKNNAPVWQGQQAVSHSLFHSS